MMGSSKPWEFKVNSRAGLGRTTSWPRYLPPSRSFLFRYARVIVNRRPYHPDLSLRVCFLSVNGHRMRLGSKMDEPNDVHSVSPPVATHAQSRPSIWQRLKGFGLRRLLLVCVGVGIGLGVGVVATVSLVVWLASRPMPSREWPLLEIEGAGLRAKLKTDWNDSLRYQLVVTPRSNDLKAAFDSAVRLRKDSISFTIHLNDKAGFELCKKEEVKPTPFVDAADRITGLRANDTFYSLECSRSDYKKADHWSLDYVFPALTADATADRVVTIDPNKPLKVLGPDKRVWTFKAGTTEEQARAYFGRKGIKAPAKTSEPATAQDNTLPQPAEADDTLTGFDSYSGHLETLSGNTFLVREGEKDVGSMWNIKVQVEGGRQPRLHITCGASGAW
jgi:hypothetical protein